MSKIALEGNASGTGTLTIAAPNTNSNYTLSIPAAGGTIVTTSSGPAFSATIGVGGATAAASGAGISFPATQSASSNANTLDDYEEGTWTPAISGATLNAATRGTYTKIGKLVTFYCALDIGSIGTGSTTIVSGLPFTPSEYGAVNVGYFANSATNIIFLTALISNSATSFDWYSITAAAATISSNAIHKNGTVIYCTGWYYAS